MARWKEKSENDELLYRQPVAGGREDDDARAERTITNNNNNNNNITDLEPVTLNKRRLVSGYNNRPITHLCALR